MDLKNNVTVVFSEFREYLMSALLNIYIIVKLQHIASYQHLSDVLQGLQASC